MHPKLSNLIELSSQTENYVKILGYKTHRKVELTKGCDESDNNYPYTIGIRTLFVNVNKSEKVTHLMIYVKTNAESSHL